MESALLKSRLATPRSPQVVYDKDEEESDNGETNSFDQVEDSGDELDRANEVSDSDDDEPLARNLTVNTDSSDDEFPIEARPRGLVRGRHDDSIDSPMVRSTMQRTCPDSLDTPISSKPQTSGRFASAAPSPMSGVKVRSPTKRSPASTSVHNMSTDQASGAPGSSRRRSKPSRRSAASVSVSSGSGSDEDFDESPAVVRSLKKPGRRVMRIESSDSDDDLSLVKSAVHQNKSGLG